MVCQLLLKCNAFMHIINDLKGSLVAPREQRLVRTLHSEIIWVKMLIWFWMDGANIFAIGPMEPPSGGLTQLGTNFLTPMGGVYEL